MKPVLFIVLLCTVFIPAESRDVYINRDTVVNDTWNLPPGTLLRFGSAGRIRGYGTIRGGIIDAALHQWIFDSTLTLQPEGTYQNLFSARWLGAGYVNDNAGVLQKGIHTVIANPTALRNFFIPRGTYPFSKPLQVFQLYKGIYAGCTIRIFGESSFWDSGSGTHLVYTATDGHALGLQLNKGSEIDHLTITGQFRAPGGSDSAYYNIPFDRFNDVNGKCGPLYAGLVIDYDGSRNSSGSTGLRIHNLHVGNFTINYLVSPNGKTFNADILLFENIRCGDAKVGFATGQAQEKGNVIRGIYSWGSIHTLFVSGRYGKQQAGQYTIDGGNIAGRCIRLFDISQAGWYSTSISNLFAESLGAVGVIRTQIPTSISNSTFHFVLPSVIGQRTLFSGNNVNIAFSGCLFRYYGVKDPMRFSGTATFTNCLFSGPRVKE
ncbi:MAG TPA: hypothetical protein PKE63_12330 [Lacibacter sp.]|nr:hypothetical protein [Lacibacter sp.]HMO90332.1 hypothetical protein [Lacibacter sp.]HMP88057.1 hypothetical protein [Lacibacter sp.]